MPIYVQYLGLPGVHKAGGGGQILSIKLGHKPLTPKNLSFEFDTIASRDAASGLATGKRQHKPIVITKEVDSSSPNLFQLEGKLIPRLVFDFRSGGPKGGEHPFYTIELTNAIISSYKRLHGTNEKLAQGSKVAHIDLEEITFTYTKITWTWVKGGITAQDDWETPVT